jgi:hypothetical protein
MTELMKTDNTLYKILLEAPESYKHGAQKFVDFLRDSNLQLNASSITQYAVHIRGKYNAANSVNHYINAMLHQVRKVVKLQEADLTVAQRYAIDEELKKIKRKKVQTAAVPQDRILKKCQAFTNCRSVFPVCKGLPSFRILRTYSSARPRVAFPVE